MMVKDRRKTRLLRQSRAQNNRALLSILTPMIAWNPLAVGMQTDPRSVDTQFLEPDPYGSG
ncbi:hypothetical protein [Corynebacterium simulans]|uniref:hypothetical protein n=1 Tax=Corynebacterium simulans TaxID=146827 RepID=UPI002006388E|nr:hypothetical protein [Corynebacterium simulans]